MNDNTAAVSEIKRLLGESLPLAYVRSFGCQLNVSDGEKIKGLLRKMGYGFTEDESEADLIILNTCAVRENAEDRVFGIVGSMKKLKELKPSLIIGITGCMTAQSHVAEKIRQSYPQVDFVLGTSAISGLPKLLLGCLNGERFAVDISEYDDFSEEAEQVRESSCKASVPIMFGCNNFCTYCIVPYVRGRERSRRPEDIISEVAGLVRSGYKEIMLLGQNVNSYGKKSSSGVDFPELLRRLNALDGDFRIRFMTSHPKDCTKELLDTMASCEKVARHLHLPFQSGSDRVLREMNRGYTAEQYIALTDYAKKVMPDISLTSDIIVGFPGETYEEFLQTLELIRRVEFTSLFTFIYSPREGTKAQKMPDPVPAPEKSAWFSQLLKTQEEIASRRSAAMVGKTYTVLIEGETKESDGRLTGRTEGNINIDFPGDKTLIGTYREVRVTKALNWILSGELV